MAEEIANRSAPKEKWYTRKEAVQFLKDRGCVASVSLLANKAANNNAGKGPAFKRSGWKGVRYSEAALIEFASRYTKVIA
jgi:hypothetical protein